jgi:hypothetical protein
MRAIFAPVLVLSLAVPTVVQSQVDYYARVGLSYGTKLVRDDIIQEIEVRQKLAPVLALGVSVPVAQKYWAGLEGTLTSGGLESKESGAATDLGSVRTGTLLLGLIVPVWQQLRWRAGIGLIGYWPQDDSGIFLQGGTTRFLAGAGLDYRRQAMRNWDLMVSLRYDFHRFTTDELVTRRFSGTQGVQRVSVSLGLARRTS